jgi:hypothetical protein
VFQPPIPIEQDSKHDCSRHYIPIRQTIIPSCITHDFSPHFTTEYAWDYCITIIHGATCFPPSTPKPRKEPKIPKRMREKPPKKKRKRKQRRRGNRGAAQFGQCHDPVDSIIGNIGDGSSISLNSPTAVDANKSLQ